MRPTGGRAVTLLAGDGVAPRLRLFCFPHAGAGVAGFHPWRRRLAPDIELALVHLPGREGRIAESPLRDMSELVAHVDELLGPYLDVPYALFGHSFGAMLAYRWASSARDHGAAPPAHLLVSGCRAPHMPDPRQGIGSWPDEALVEEIVRLGGTPAEILQNDEMMALVLPVFRADLEAFVSRGRSSETPLPCRITAFAGAADPVASPATMEGWREHGRGFALHVFPGRHFFVQEAMEQVVQRVGQVLRDGAAVRQSGPL